MKKPISATIDDELIQWIDKQTKNSFSYRNRSHLIETALRLLKKRTKEQKRGGD